MTNIRSFLVHSFVLLNRKVHIGVPIAYYKKSKFPSCAKLNARIVCLLHPDVLQNDIQLSNIGINHTIIYD
jgi:hypothetical protein